MSEEIYISEDLLIYINKYLDDPDSIINFCLTNRSINGVICENNKLWENIVKERYPYAYHYKEDNISWFKFYYYLSRYSVDNFIVFYRYNSWSRAPIANYKYSVYLPTGTVIDYNFMDSDGEYPPLIDNSGVQNLEVRTLLSYEENPYIDNNSVFENTFYKFYNDLIDLSIYDSSITEDIVIDAINKNKENFYLRNSYEFLQWICSFNENNEYNSIIDELYDILKIKTKRIYKCEYDPSLRNTIVDDNEEFYDYIEDIEEFENEEENDEQ